MYLKEIQNTDYSQGTGYAAENEELRISPCLSLESAALPRYRLPFSHTDRQMLSSQCFPPDTESPKKPCQLGRDLEVVSFTSVVLKKCPKALGGST